MDLFAENQDVNYSDLLFAPNSSRFLPPSSLQAVLFDLARKNIPHDSQTRVDHEETTIST